MPYPPFPNSMQDVAIDDGDRVAVLMRTRNRPLLLGRAFRSVLDQRHQHWHLVVVNDGGDPGPVDRLAGELAERWGGRLSVLHHVAALGMEAASNAALAHAAALGRFDHVAVHDDDDSWDPDFLAATTAFLADPGNRRFAAVMTHWTVAHERLLADRVEEVARQPGPFTAAVLEFGDLLARNRFPPIALLVRRAAIDRAGTFNAMLPVLGDWDFNLRLMLAGDIGVLPRPLACYHRRDPSAPPVYNNTAAAVADPHGLYGALYRNSRLRALGLHDPAFLSLLHVLGLQIERYHESDQGFLRLFMESLDRIERRNEDQRATSDHRLDRMEAVLARIEHGLAAEPAARPREAGWPGRRMRSLFRRLRSRLPGAD